MSQPQHLSDKSIVILKMMANGHSYSQIVDSHPEITYPDIFAAAAEAIRLNEAQTGYHERMAEIKLQHVRAYERWTPEEDAELSAMHANRRTVQEMSGHFQRQPSAIRSRLAKLGLIG